MCNGLLNINCDMGDLSCKQTLEDIFQDVTIVELGIILILYLLKKMADILGLYG